MLQIFRSVSGKLSARLCRPLPSSTSLSCYAMTTRDSNVSKPRSPPAAASKHSTKRENGKTTLSVKSKPPLRQRPAEQPEHRGSEVVSHTQTHQEESPDSSSPTYVPRNPGVKDGSWSRVDAAVVEQAQQQARQVDKKNQTAGDTLLGKTVEELTALAVECGQPGYRGKQLYDAVTQGARSLDQISTVPKAFRVQLQERGLRTGRSIVHHSVEAKDGTRKFLLQLHDGRVVETVGIPADDVDRARLTVCVSSQVGCPMRCTFCATGKGGFARNLAAHEILDQVLTVQEMFQRRVSNVVFMGMGEPLLNLRAVVSAYHMMNTELGISARSLTISTVGVPNAITKLAREELKSTLAVSIHAPNQALRERLIPSAKAYPLEALMAECVEYYRITGRRVTFEYTLMEGMNDGKEHAEELVALLRRHDLLSHVNIIPWNPVEESEFKRPSNNRVHKFKEVLEQGQVPVSIRLTRGLEAAAACGQLRNMFQKTPLTEFTVPA